MCLFHDDDDAERGREREIGGRDEEETCCKQAIEIKIICNRELDR
jgi:hypothetical protein